MTLNRIASKQEVIARMTQGTDDIIHTDAQFVRTDNGYWVAWHEQSAAVLHEDAANGEPCFWVEGVASLSELVDMLTNGDFDEIEEFEGDDQDWNNVVLDSDAHHDHDATACHDEHCQHKH